jgi:hypothetical protein
VSSTGVEAVAFGNPPPGVSVRPPLWTTASVAEVGAARLVTPNAAATGEMASAAASISAVDSVVPGAGLAAAVPVVVVSAEPVPVVGDALVVAAAEDDPCPDVPEFAVAGSWLAEVPVVVSAEPVPVVDALVAVEAEDDPCPDALEFVAPESWLAEVPVVVVSADPVPVVGDALLGAEDDAGEALLDVIDSFPSI